MGAFSGIGDLIKQFAGNNAGDAGQLLQQLAGSAPQSSVAGGLAEAFKSDQTAPFSQLASQLFSNSSGDQKASVLNSLVAAVGPSVLSQLTGSSSSTLAGLLQGNQAPITPEQADAVKPEEMQELAEHAHTADPSIVDRISEIYAAHPQLIQTLGAAAVSVAVAHIAKNHQG